MNDHHETEVEYLRRVRKSDIDKMPAEIAGYRTTTEIATFMGKTNRAVIKTLSPLCDSGVIECYLDGGSCIWRATQ